ncbi:MAG: phospho-sugar mutase, partial [Slackia sp.]|nr:phospho-sugar mutase [Slackia sp.]
MGEIDVRAAFARWVEHAQDEDTAADLARLEQAGDAAIADAFFQNLEFGTAGLRGVIGAGTNRMNVYTVARATQGLADYLNDRFDDPCVAIARDSRHKGELFVRTAARVLAANGVRCHIYPRVEPTPALSFAVRYLGCSAGINMTASHNPAAYNGYKVYGADGCQITSDAAKDISARIAQLGYFESDERSARMIDFDRAVDAGMVSMIDDEVLDRFVDAVLDQSQEAPGDSDLPLDVVYTPLCGTGLECVGAALARIGLAQLDVVDRQAQPDGDFPTCEYPNPEERAALEEGIARCRERAAEGLAPDLLLATDPDADRVGVACEDGDDYALITGNEMGILLMDYLARMRASRGQDLARCIAVTTIVSSAMADDVARAHGFELRRTLTGFKYIGE